MTDVKINVTFVIPKHCKDENDCSEDMLIAYTTCENHRGGGLQAQWAHEKSVTFDRPFTKSDIFVLSVFEGELYEKLKATKCLLVGPRCLSCSLTEGSSIPTKGHPVYTIAMRGLIVSLSGLSKELKTSLKQKIEWMGGTYSAVLSSETTHLVANNVFSDKYMKAAETGIPVMKDTWISAVWEASLKLDVNGASSEFDDHRLPPFANLQITTSGLNSHDKKLIMKLVNANGGEFSRVFLSQTTNVLVLTKESTSSEKYKAALEFGKVCVTPHWVKDSAALGFALPAARYKVTSTTTSSPVRDRQVPDISLNLTRITRDGKPSNFVDESKMAESMSLSVTPKVQRESKKDSITDEIQRAFEAFDVASIKKAGPIFDGFCIWVSGLDGMPRDRAWACVSKAGGTRYDGPNGRVTHAVSCGAAAAAAAAALPAVPVLSPLWLVRSVEARRVLDEAEVLCRAARRGAAAALPAVPVLSPLWLVRSVEARRVLDEAEVLCRAARRGAAAALPAVPVLSPLWLVRSVEARRVLDEAEVLCRAARRGAAAALPAVPVLSPLWLVRSVEARRVLDEAEVLCRAARRGAAAALPAVPVLSPLWLVRSVEARRVLDEAEVLCRAARRGAAAALPAVPVLSPLWLVRSVEARRVLDEAEVLCRAARRGAAAALPAVPVLSPLWLVRSVEARRVLDEAEVLCRAARRGAAAALPAVPVLSPLWLVRSVEARRVLDEAEVLCRAARRGAAAALPAVPVLSPLWLVRSVEARRVLDEAEVLCRAARRGAAAALPAVPVLSPLWLVRSVEARRVLDEAEVLCRAARRGAAAALPAVPVLSPLWLVRSVEARRVLDEAEVLCRAARRGAAAALPAVPVLSPLWLVRSVEARRVLDEAEFVINTQPATPRKTTQPALAAASPMSKRTLQMLLPPRDTTVTTEEPQRDHIVDHYLSQNQSQAAEANNKSPEPVERKETTKNDEDTAATVEEFTQSENIFKGLVFEVQGLEDEAICEIGAEILATGGTVAAAGAGGTHVLVPLDFHTTRGGAGEAVTVFWVKDCLSRQELTPIEYYHRPVHLKDPNANPLHGVVLSLSTYSGVERAFLDELAKLLGATVQQRFCRRNNDGALASSHLVCPSASGAKYSAARKWGVPCVRGGWLLACAGAARRVDEAAHEVDPEDADSTSGQQNAPVNDNRTPKTPPEPRKPTPEPDKRTSAPEERMTAPEERMTAPEKRPSEPEVRPPEPRSRTPGALPHEDLDAFLVPDVEQILPPDVANCASPLGKPQRRERYEGMSPASRFITMRRKGMFTDHEDISKENTPKKAHDESDAKHSSLRSVPDQHTTAALHDAAGIQTPPLEDVLSSPNLRGFSPDTRRVLQALRRGELPEEPIKTPDNPFDKAIETPDSAFGAILRPGRKRMSVDARKRLWKIVNELPTNEPRRRASDLETPPAKMGKLTVDQSAGGARVSEPPPAPPARPSPPPAPPARPAPPPAVPREVEEQLQRLNVVLTGRRTPRRASRPLQPGRPADMEYESGPESQPNTVGWDDTTPSQKDSLESVSKPRRVDTVAALDPSETEPENTVNLDRSKLEGKDVNAAHASKMEVKLVSQTKGNAAPKTVKRFMLSSNVDNREETVEMIVRLGGEVTDLEEEEEGPPATHLLCCAPARSQRVLNCIAGGCWVLHPAYVARSAAAGVFLQEEEYEWGNPLASCLPAVSGGERALAAAAHRARARRAAGLPGPFAGLAALLHAPEQRRRLLARLVKAGGGTTVDEEPPYTDETINVCFADPKRYPMKERDRAWLVSRGVPVCASILLSAFLTEENRPDLSQHCLPEFKA